MLPATILHEEYWLALYSHGDQLAPVLMILNKAFTLLFLIAILQALITDVLYFPTEIKGKNKFLYVPMVLTK